MEETIFQPHTICHQIKSLVTAAGYTCLRCWQKSYYRPLKHFLYGYAQQPYNKMPLLKKPPLVLKGITPYT